MPGIFHRPISRKTFLATAAKLTGAAALAQIGASAIAADESAEKSDRGVRVALLSDTHIPADASNEYRGFRPVENLRKIVPQVVASKSELAILNGDAARLTGQKNDYLALKSLLAPVAAQTPIYIGLGNHDDRGNFYRVFDDASKTSTVKGKQVAVVDRGGLRFIVLDSLLYVDKVAGLLGKAQRTWLAKFLEESDDRPHVLFVHHTLKDGDGDLLDADRLFAILQRHRKVKALFYGHSHRYVFEKHKHIHLINLPAIGYNFTDSDPVGWVEGSFSTAGVELKLHAIGGNRDGDEKVTSIDWS